MLVRLLPAMNETGESQSEARMVTFDQSEAWKLSQKLTLTTQTEVTHEAHLARARTELIVDQS